MRTPGAQQHKMLAHLAAQTARIVRQTLRLAATEKLQLRALAMVQSLTAVAGLHAAPADGS